MAYQEIAHGSDRLSHERQRNTLRNGAQPGGAGMADVQRFFASRSAAGALVLSIVACVYVPLVILPRGSSEYLTTELFDGYDWIWTRPAGIIDLRRLLVELGGILFVTLLSYRLERWRVQ